MSDLDNELLALAGGEITKTSSNSATASSVTHTSSRRPRKPATSTKSKRRRTLEMDTESDMDMSSGSEAAALPDAAESSSAEEEHRASVANPYPYEGIYKDLADKQKIQSMSELDREAILEDRQDELQKIRDRENIKNMVRAREEETGRRSSGREKSRTGTSAEKAHKLDELKKKRQAKERKPKADEASANESGRRRRSVAWDEGSEDGEIDVVEEQALVREERAARRLEESATIDDIRRILLTRHRAAELCSAKFFDDYVKGMWVRVSVGFSKDDPKREMVYRVGEIRAVTQHTKYYEVEQQATQVSLTLVLAKDEKPVLLDVISNSTIQESEWKFVLGECRKHNVPIPSKKEIARKYKFIQKYKDWVKDESIITAQVRAKKELKAQNHGPTALTVSERLRLESERDQALALGNTELHEKLDQMLQLAYVSPVKTENSLMTELNERNRRANREEIRRAELAASESRRQKMKAGEGGVGDRADSSARLTMVSPLKHEARALSGSFSSDSNTVKNGAAVKTRANGPRTRFEELIASQIRLDIDIADF